MVRLCGAALGLFAFAITILLGMNAGNPVEVILQRALMAMLFFFVLGVTVGWIAFRVIDEHAVRLHKDMFPAEEEVDAADSDGDNESERGTGDSQPAGTQN